MFLAVFDITKYSKDGVVEEPVFEQKTGTIRWVVETIGQDLIPTLIIIIAIKSS